MAPRTDEKKRRIDEITNAYIGKWPSLCDPKLSHLTPREEDLYIRAIDSVQDTEEINESLDDFAGHVKTIGAARWERIMEEVNADYRDAKLGQREEESSGEGEGGKNKGKGKKKEEHADDIKPRFANWKSCSTAYYRYKRECEQAIRRGIKVEDDSEEDGVGYS